MRAVRALLATLLFASVGLITPAGATSVTTDQSDLWYVPTESGWGMQLVQRDSVIFATIYVYDQTNTPIWYTATLEYQGNFAWTGDLYLTSGPWFGTTPFNPNAVGYRRVGAMTWNATSTTNGTLRYDVDGVFVVKNMTRILLRYDNFHGRYAGAVHQSSAGCFQAADNGTVELIAALGVTQNGTSISMRSSDVSGGVCTYSGTLSQAGQMGQVAGTYSCNGGDAGTFNFFEMQVNISGITGRFTAKSGPFGCVATGWFGGMRGTTF